MRAEVEVVEAHDDQRWASHVPREHIEGTLPDRCANAIAGMRAAVELLNMNEPRLSRAVLMATLVKVEP